MNSLTSSLKGIKSLCANCNYESFLRKIEVIVKIDPKTVKDACFYMNHRERMIGIKIWVENNRHITERQTNFVDDMYFKYVEKDKSKKPSTEKLVRRWNKWKIYN